MLVSSISWPERSKLKIDLKSHISQPSRPDNVQLFLFPDLSSLKMKSCKIEICSDPESKERFFFWLLLLHSDSLLSCQAVRMCKPSVFGCRRDLSILFVLDMFLKWEIIHYEWKYPHQVTSLKPLWLMMVKLLHFFCDLKQKPSVKYCGHVNIIQPVYSWRN